MNMGDEKLKELVLSDNFYITQEALELLKTKTDSPVAGQRS